MKPKKKAILSLEAWPMLDDLTQQSENEAELRTELDDLTRQRNDIVVRKRQLSQEMEKLDQKGVEVDTSITWLKEVIRQERKKVIDEDGVMIVESRRDTHLVRFVWQGFDQGGDDCGIPKRYTPCRYFFKSAGGTGVALGCNRPECEFSHDPIFKEEPFYSCLQKIHWARPKPREMQTAPWARSQKQLMEEQNYKKRRC